MKKVLFIIPSLRVGGLEKVQVSIANAIARKGYDVTIMILNSDYDLWQQLDKNIKCVYKPSKPHKIMKNIPYIRHKFYDDGMWERRASPKALYKYYVGNEKYDVEIAFFRGLPVKIISGSTNKEAVKLSWVHSDFRHAKGYNNEFKDMNALFEAYKCFEKVICVSNEARIGFKEIIGDTGNLTTIYNLLPIEHIISNSEKKLDINIHNSSFKLILVGRLFDAAKGQRRLIRVVSQLNKEGYDLSLLLVGGGADEKLIKNFIYENSADKYVFMTGSQVNPYPYIKNADLLVCASYFEGYNLTVAEALILGVPVLSTNCAGPNEILNYGEYGMIVDNSENGLYQGIKYLMDKPQKLAYYKEKAKERLDFFDEEKIIGQIIDLF